MKIVAFLFPALLAAKQCVCLPKSAPFSQVVVFGDSLSDNGNGTYLLTNKTWPADPAYYNGRFSNGPTWVEYLGGDFQVNVKDLAHGGATVNNTRVQGYTGYNSTVPVPSVLEQISEHIKEDDGKVDSEALYIVSGGGNDAYFGASSPGMDPKELASWTVKDFAYAVEKLTKSGGRRFLLPTTAGLRTSPYGVHFADNATRAFLASFTKSFGKALRQQTFSKHAHVVLFNENEALNRLESKGKNYGFDSVADACLKGVYPGEYPTRQLCSNVLQHVFWDIYHPTTKTHRLLADSARAALRTGGSTTFVKQ